MPLPSSRAGHEPRALLQDVATRERGVLATERRILAAAEQRLATVQQAIETTAKTAVSNPESGARYLQLVLERGRLNQIIDQAEQRLGTG